MTTAATESETRAAIEAIVIPTIALVVSGLEDPVADAEGERGENQGSVSVGHVGLGVGVTQVGVAVG
jgi:heme/copper-type cytochrome/quinol oxidase subunit 3